ncbi:hypothetical protein C8R43DRAFT_1091732 [Mycena crocata]|nr:hypothetical protein C8R43DRAFT_1091732 [Mycena crocata]
MCPERTPQVRGCWCREPLEAMVVGKKEWRRGFEQETTRKDGRSRPILSLTGMQLLDSFGLRTRSIVFSRERVDNVAEDDMMVRVEETKSLFATVILHDIRRVFHPSSGRDTIQQSLDEYRKSQMPPGRRPPTDSEPWLPFRTRLDFEFAEFAVDVMLNKNQTTNFHSELEDHWERVSKKCTQFKRTEVSVPYKKTDRVFEMYARPLWEWTLDLVQDPHLADFFVWDVERDYKFNGQKWIRFFSEPWTGKAMWEIQDQLPKGPDHKSLPYIVYADKAKLSSFGTQKGYPIVARLANIVIGLRNSNNWGGGQIVGWLPVVPEDEKEKSKPAYVNFKNAVWHRAFYQLLESIALFSKTGAWIKCGDGKSRRLGPLILILAADYEETCVMTLIRGLKSKFPCPMCYVKNKDQADLFPPVLPALRNRERSKAVLYRTRKQRTAENRENILKAHGLRNVENVFWRIAFSDPHQAASFEHLHSYASGLWGHHLFSQIKKHADLAPGRAAGQIDSQFAAFPRWRNLNHFNAVMGLSFNDGTKHTDISKTIILVSHNVLTEDIDILLLQCIRSYQELDMWATLRKPDGETIAAGRAEMKNFQRLMEEYVEAFKLLKTWNFIKIHLQTHLFDDIERKVYLRQTNFKNVAPQILKSDHRRLVSKFIRDQLNDIDEAWQREWDGEDEEQEQEGGSQIREDVPKDLHQLSGNISLGSKQPDISFNDLEASDPSFLRFRLSLTDFLNDFLVTYGHPLPDGKRVKLLGSQISPYRFLKVFYQSLDDWADETDFLRCNPCFHGSPRFDGALMFQISLEETYPFALVEPLDAPLGRLQAKDKALKLFRVRARRKTEFIAVHSIVRGAVLCPDFDQEGDYFVMDTQGADMFLRMRKMYVDRLR